MGSGLPTGSSRGPIPVCRRRADPGPLGRARGRASRSGHWLEPQPSATPGSRRFSTGPAPTFSTTQPSGFSAFPSGGFTTKNPPGTSPRRCSAQSASTHGHGVEPPRARSQAGVPNTARLLTGTGNLVTIQRWREISELYDRLSMTPGPSPQTRGWAKTLGYAPPLAWDEDTIDDPRSRPHGNGGEHASGQVIDMVAIRHTLDEPGRPAT